MPYPLSCMSNDLPTTFKPLPTWTLKPSLSKSYKNITFHYKTWITKRQKTHTTTAPLKSATLIRYKQLRHDTDHYARLHQVQVIPTNTTIPRTPKENKARNKTQPNIKPKIETKTKSKPFKNKIK